MVTLVVSHYDKDLWWLHNINKAKVKVFVYHRKSSHAVYIPDAFNILVPTIGNDSFAYYYHLLSWEHKDKLVFVNDYPFEFISTAEFDENIYTDAVIPNYVAAKDFSWLTDELLVNVTDEELEDAVYHLFEDEYPLGFTIGVGNQFSISAESANKRKHLYRKAFDSSLWSVLPDLWHYIATKELHE